MTRTVKTLHTHFKSWLKAGGLRRESFRLATKLTVMLPIPSLQTQASLWCSTNYTATCSEMQEFSKLAAHSDNPPFSQALGSHRFLHQEHLLKEAVLSEPGGLLPEDAFNPTVKSLATRQRRWQAG